MIRAHTGPSKLNQRQQRWAAMRMLSVQPIADVWRSGCAFGIDSVAAWLAIATGAKLELYVPEAFHNDIMVEHIHEYAHRVVRCYLPRGSAAEAYRTRNRKLIEDCDQLVAFVWKDSFYRSGEWMTINLARQTGIEVIMHTIPGVRT